MVIEEIVGDAVATLTGHLTNKVVGKLEEKANELYQKVKVKFSDDSYAEQTLKRVEEQPASKGRQAALEEVMTEKMKEDSVFAEEIKRLVEEVKKVPGSNTVIAFGERSVAVGGNVTGHIITGDNSGINKQ